MNLVKLIKKIFNETMFLFFRPRLHWEMIKSGKNQSTLVLRKFILPGLILIFIFSQLGDFIFNSEYGYLWKDSLIKATLKIILLLFVFIISRILTYEVSKLFQVEISKGIIKRVAIYSIMPAIMTGIVTGLLPFLNLGGFLPWYGLYIAYLGIEMYSKIDDRKKFYFYFILFTGIFFLSMIFSFVLKRISFNLMY
jgi:hypothetical protein